MKGVDGLWYRLASHLKTPVPRLREEISPMDFCEWNVHLDNLQWNNRDKQEHYMAAIRYDINSLIYTVRKMLGSGDIRQPELEDMYLKFGKEGTRATDPIKPPEGHGYLMEGDNGDFDKGYGLPGVDTESSKPLDAKWQEINDNEKLKWQALTATGLVKVLKE